MERGVVEIALNGLASLLDPDFHAPVTESDPGIWTMARATAYGGCRFNLVGTTATEHVSERLIAEVRDRAREALVVCVLPTAGLEIVAHRGAVPRDVLTSVLAFYPNDLDALANGDVTLEDLVDYKYRRRFLDQRPDAQSQYARHVFESYGYAHRLSTSPLRPLSAAVRDKGESQGDWLEHPYVAELDGVLAHRRSVLLIGYSSSGKTVLAMQLGSRRASAGWSVKYMNLGDTGSRVAGLVRQLIFSDGSSGDGDGGHAGRAAGELIIFDDLQSNPATARLLLAVASLTERAADESRRTFIAVSWKEFAREAAAACPELTPKAVHPGLVRDRLIATYRERIGREAVDALAAELGDDIYLFRLALEVTDRQHRRPSRGQVAEDVWRRRMPDEEGIGLSAEARRVALLAGAIGQFDIHVSGEFLCRGASVDQRVVSRLIESRLLRRAGDLLTIGHRSLCALIAWWLGSTGVWQELARVGGPGDVTRAVLTHLEQSGTGATIDALRALIARAGFKRAEALSSRAAALMSVWRAFDAVVERVEQQQLADPTWGGVPSSSMFVTKLLTEMDRAALAKPSLDFLRSHWRIAGGELQIDTRGLATVVDFNLIHQRILDEDEAAPGQPYESGVTIDIDRFHKTWLAGLILGAEAAAEGSTLIHEDLDALISKMQVGPSGAFYPQRVPWCTARVLLGLAACRRTIETSACSRRAADWLMRERVDGGARVGGIWYSGTGTWNTLVETTALVILGLVRAGVDPSDPRLEPGREALLSHREEWEGADGALAIEALLATGTAWHELAGDTERLSRWALDQSLWQQATLPADQVLKQTCHVAQAATHLVEIGWTALRSDLPALLDALEISEVRAPGANQLTEMREEADAARVPLRTASYANNGDEHAAAVANVESLELGRYRVVGDYSRYDDRARNVLVGRCAAIRGALTTKTFARENYLIWAPPGSGKSYLIQELARSMGLVEDQRYFELNLADLSRADFTSGLEAVRISARTPTFCLIDEIDARSSEAWPYELIFPALDLNLVPDHHAVFVLVGSGGAGLNALIQAMRSRPKGSDLLDRVPEDRRFEIPKLAAGDRLVVFAKQILLAAAARKQEVQYIDRLALYFVLAGAENLGTPRQLAELAKAAVGRMDAADPRLLYDHLFRDGDSNRMSFYGQHIDVATSLQNMCVPLNND
jgi:hypothetical protein